MNGAATLKSLISGFWVAPISASRPSKWAPDALSESIVAVALIVPKNVARLGIGTPAVKLAFDLSWMSWRLLSESAGRSSTVPPAWTAKWPVDPTSMPVSPGFGTTRQLIGCASNVV